MIPGKVIYLVKHVVITGVGITGSGQCLAVDGERFVIIFRQEIIAVIRIRITRVYGSLCRFPCHRTDTIEDPFAAHRTCRHLFQVICFCKVIACQTLGLEGSTIAVDLHLRQIREASFLDERVCQLIEAIVRDTDLHPFARLQHGMIRITLS